MPHENRTGQVGTGRWFEPGRPAVRLEVGTRNYRRQSSRQNRSAFFFSGGIGSMACLRINHRHFPPGHPRYFQDSIFIYGNAIEADHPRAMQDFKAVADDGGFHLLVVYTNVRSLDPAAEFFHTEFSGAIMGAMAQALAGRVMSADIAGTQSLKDHLLFGRNDLQPIGSHPLLDPYFSSHDLDVRLMHSRLDKIRLVAVWEAALQHIKACQSGYPGRNCCRCEKCVRTMLGLEAAGALRRTKAFDPEITPAHLSGIRVPISIRQEYCQLIEPLLEIGRDDLARAIQRSILGVLQPRPPARRRIRKVAGEKSAAGSSGAKLSY